MTNHNLIFEGYWECDHFDRGYAKIPYYIGEISSGNLYDGPGTLFYDKEGKKKRISGKFVKGLLSGQGIEYYDNENNDIKYQGLFHEGKYDG